MIPGRPPDVIVSDRDTEALLNSPEYGETAYLRNTLSPDDTTTTPPAHPRDVILYGVDGYPKKGPDGKPIYIKGKTQEELLGISFLHRHDDGTQERATVIKPRPERLKGNKDYDKFVIKYDKSQVEDVMTYNDIMNYLHRDQLADDGTLWKFRRILGHQGPLTSSDRHWKGSTYNVEVEWENGELSYEPLALMKDDDPVTVAKCAADNNMLETP